MLKKIIAQLLLPSLAAMSAISSFAWDSERPIALPSPTGTVPKGLSVNGVTIDVEGSMVTTSYVIANKDDKSKANVFAIYMPPFSWSGVASDYPDRHFPELKVTSDGNKVRLGTNIIALHDGREITRDLALAGINPSRVGLGEEALLDIGQPSKGKYSSLIAKGALQAAGGVYLPKWYAQVSYWWKQTYEPRKDARIDLQYMARPGFFSVSKADKRLASYVLGHCGSEGDLEDIASGSLFKGKGDLTVKTYILPFNLGDLNLDEAVLNYSSGTDAVASGQAISYVCTSPTGTGAKGNPSLLNVNIRNQDGFVSILEISRQ